ncbi:hypothetical protein HYH02_006599 [Chlamydomonas schloesseri]|uniref:HECT-type E3 ubiquitin transferase n=1 Tax=Chlamydomonas schloesseri TaxID=2026947 RepID=A0A835T526_9CHLO|nr:hypothetical protein HYH02_006599 [Chlamydomonas schloesseri]|eukprot:KAG2439072.1 hypothetical protein HYH02_006599 [Chlamydomonas schloesseri]
MSSGEVSGSEPRPNYSGLPLEEQRKLFTDEVTRAFNALRARGMEPNEAAALALKVAAGVADLPPSPDDVARRLSAAGTPVRELLAAVTRFFASPDCLAAAFWPQQQQQQQQQRDSGEEPVAAAAPIASTSSSTAGGSSSRSSGDGSSGRGGAQPAASSNGTEASGLGAGGTEGGRSKGGRGSAVAAATATARACPLDFTAVAALYDAVLGTAVPPPPPQTDASSAAAVSASSSSGESGGIGGSSPPSTSAASTAASLLSPTGSNSFGALPPRALGPVTAAPPPATAAATTAERPFGHSAMLRSALTTGVEGLLAGLGALPAALNPALPRQLGVLLACPLLDKAEHHDLMGSLVCFIGGLSPVQRRALADLLATYPGDELRRLVTRLHSFISMTLFRMQSITRGVEDATRLLALVHEANEEAGRRAAAAAARPATASASAPASASASVSSAPSPPAAPLSSLGFSALGRMGDSATAAVAAGLAAGWRPLEPAAFYNDAINHEDFNLKEDFRKWKHPHKYDFCFCKFPFMYDPGSKARLLQMENQMSQVNELHSALFRGLFGGPGGGGGGPGGGLGSGLVGGVGGGGLGTMPDMCPFLVLRVRRGPYLVQDTLIQIHRAKETDSLRKPLKVKFVGEEGVDEGGVAKEFFQLLVRQLFNPDYGMFTSDPNSHLHWFRPTSGSNKLGAGGDDMELEFELVGILIGLAIYNSHILEFQFPPVLYKKLMGAVCPEPPSPSSLVMGRPEGKTGERGMARPSTALQQQQDRAGPAGTAAPRAAAAAAAGAGAGAGGAGGGSNAGTLGLEDLVDLAPEVAASLAKLLELEPELVPGLGLCFQVDMEVGFGEVESVDLLPGGGELEVTAANRRAYVDLYVRHLLQDSIAPQFGPFRRGFLRLCSGAALAHWFTAAELELLVCGSRALRLEELEAATQYDDGYTRDSEPVRWFWEVAHSLPPAGQKRLLFFVTGSDRVPIKGLAHLNPPFVISRAGAHSDRLPSAHTCFNHLLLPHYNSKEVLRERLELSLQNAEGFGLM